MQDEANISRKNDERVWCVSNGDQCIIFHIMEESNRSVASVDSNGRITGNKAGTATISAKLKNRDRDNDFEEDQSRTDEIPAN